MVNILGIIGHGDKDPGACYQSEREVVHNEIQMKSCKEYLMKNYEGINFVLETDLGKNGDINYEIALANKKSYDLIFSGHNNSGGGDGWEGLCYDKTCEGYNLCKCIEAEVIAIGQNSRGVKIRKDLGIINGVKPPSVIMEGYFIDNVKDYVDDKKLGVAYAKGIAKYYKLKKKTVEKPKCTECEKLKKEISELKKKIDDAKKALQ